MTKNQCFGLSLAAGVLGSGINARADTFQVTGQSRSATANVTATGSNGTAGAAGPLFANQSSTSVISGTTFNPSLAEVASLVIPTVGFPQPLFYNGSSAALQNSLVSASLLSGTGSTSAGSQEETDSGSTESNASSSYLSSFTVLSPTPVLLTGSLTGTAVYHLGALERLSDSISLTGSASGSLYSLSAPGPAVGTNLLNGTLNDPIAFQTTLLPGQTYTLSVAAYSDSFREGVGEGNVGVGTEAFAFSLAPVPEPTCLAVVAVTALVLPRARRGRRSVPCRPANCYRRLAVVGLQPMPAN